MPILRSAVAGLRCAILPFAGYPRCVPHTRLLRLVRTFTVTFTLDSVYAVPTLILRYVLDLHLLIYVVPLRSYVYVRLFARSTPFPFVRLPRCLLRYYTLYVYARLRFTFDYVDLRFGCTFYRVLLVAVIRAVVDCQLHTRLRCVLAFGCVATVCCGYVYVAVHLDFTLVRFVPVTRTPFAFTFYHSCRFTVPCVCHLPLRVLRYYRLRTLVGLPLYHTFTLPFTFCAHGLFVCSFWMRYTRLDVYVYARITFGCSTFGCP